VVLKVVRARTSAGFKPPITANLGLAVAAVAATLALTACGAAEAERPHHELDRQPVKHHAGDERGTYG